LRRRLTSHNAAINSGAMINIINPWFMFVLLL